MKNYQFHYCTCIQCTVSGKTVILFLPYIILNANQRTKQTYQKTGEDLEMGLTAPVFNAIAILYSLSPLHGCMNNQCRPRCYVKSPTALDAFWPSPGFIICMQYVTGTKHAWVDKLLGSMPSAC